MHLQTAEEEYTYVWRWKRSHPERKGQRCKITWRGTYEVVVQFIDGSELRAHRCAVQRA